MWPVFVASVSVSFLVIKLWVENYTTKQFASRVSHENLLNTYYAHANATSTQLTEIAGHFKLIEERMSNSMETAKAQNENLISKIDHLNSNLKTADGGERKLLMEAIMKLIDNNERSNK